MNDRMIKVGVIIALVIASMATIGIVTEESDASHAYHDIDLGDRILEVGQEMEIDLTDKMVMMNNYKGSFTEFEIDSSAPSWISVETDMGESLTRDSEVRLVLTPTAISAGEYRIVFDTVRSYGASVTDITFTVTLGVTVIASSSSADKVDVTFDSDDGFSDFSRISCAVGSSMTLPGAELTGMIFMGWFDGEDRVGGAGDAYAPTEDSTLTAVWESDPDYVAPGTYDWIITAAIIGTIVLIAIVLIVKGRP